MELIKTGEPLEVKLFGSLLTMPVAVKAVRPIHGRLLANLSVTSKQARTICTLVASNGAINPKIVNGSTVQFSITDSNKSNFGLEGYEFAQDAA